MALLSYAFHHDQNNLWFSFLTDSCVPIISPEKFRKLFFDHYEASIIKCKRAYWDISIHRRANLRLFTKEYWLANDPWFTLSRDHVQKCILFLAAKNNIYKSVIEGGLANESLFAIILQTFKEIVNPFKTINDSATIADWTRMASPTSPYLFEVESPENINIIGELLKENKYAMFLRKVHPSFPDQTIKDIWQKNIEHKYEMLHNRVTKKTYVNHCLGLLVECCITLVYLGACLYTIFFAKLAVKA
jgi:hypothetical protein